MALATEGTACTSIVSTEKPGEKPTVTTNSQLMRRATSCPDLEQALKEEIRARLALMMQERGNADEDSWGVAGSGGASSADAGASSAGGPASETGGSGGGSSDSGGSAGPGIAPPGAYTGTNTQVAGVDEADFVKTDGQRIYQLREQMLHVARAWPVAELSLQSSAQIEGTPLEMFLVGDAGSADQKLVVYSMVDGTSIYAQAGLEPPRHDAVPQPAAPWGTGGSPGGDMPVASAAVTLTKITVVSVAGPSPSVLQEVYFDGNYVSSRRLDTNVRTVLQVPGNLPELRTYATEADRWKAEMLVISRLLQEGKNVADIPSEELAEMVRAALGEVLAHENEAAIEGMKYSDWLPHVFTKAGNQIVTTAVACENFYIPKAGTSQIGITHVAPLDLANPTAPATGTAIVGVADTMYQNSNAMVLASTGFDGDFNNPSYSTYVHAFDLQGLPLPAYKASGVVHGRIHGQFAVDEKDGFVRVVTTTGEQWSRQGTANHLFVLENVDGTLQVAGDAGDFAQNEQVYAVRYVGDTAYVVTFRQTDPLFAIDLSNPRSPSIIGELHIPGFSEYMHPLGTTHLLTVGRDADPNTGWGQNLALQIFDVTNRTDPKLAHKVIFDSDGASAAESEHKAFTYFDDRQLLAIPYVGYNFDPNMGYASLRSSMVLYRVSVQQGFTGLGAMSGDALLSNAERDPAHYYCDAYAYYQGSGSAFQRGIFIDDVLFGVARDGVVAANVAKPSEALGVLLLKDPAVVPPNCWEQGGYGGYAGGGTGGSGGWETGGAGGAIWDDGGTAGGGEWDAGAAGGGGSPAWDAGGVGGSGG